MKQHNAEAAIAADDLQLLTPSEVARLLRVSRRTLQDMTARGQWPQPLRLTNKTVRWPRATVDAALRGGACIFAATAVTGGQQ